MMQYMLTAQVLGIIQVCPSRVCIRHMSQPDLEWLRQISPSPCLTIAYTDHGLGFYALLSSKNYGNSM